MMQRVTQPEFADDVLELDNASPAAVWLANTLCGCMHPKAARLLKRLSLHPSQEELRELHSEVCELLVLSFGPVEARRRLQ